MGGVELKPCPFCGTDDHLYPAHRWPGGGKPYAIDCVRCGFDFTPREGMDVIEAWNKRAELDRLNARVTDLMKQDRQAADLIDALQADLAKHREALEPFGRCAEVLDANLTRNVGVVWGADYRPIGSEVPPMSDFRRARALTQDGSKP